MPRIKICGKRFNSTEETEMIHWISRLFQHAPYWGLIVVSFDDSRVRSLDFKDSPYVELCGTPEHFDAYPGDAEKRLGALGLDIEVHVLKEFIEAPASK